MLVQRGTTSKLEPRVSAHIVRDRIINRSRHSIKQELNHFSDGCSMSHYGDELTACVLWTQVHCSSSMMAISISISTHLIRHVLNQQVRRRILLLDYLR